MLGSLILYLKGMRIMMFQLSGLYYRALEPQTLNPKLPCEPLPKPRILKSAYKQVVIYADPALLHSKAPKFKKPKTNKGDEASSVAIEAAGHSKVPSSSRSSLGSLFWA